MKHCIVTMEIAGPTKNGGIGTHCYYLAKFLRKTMGHEVTVLLGCPPLKEHSSSYWKVHFRKELDIEFEQISDYPPFSDLPGPHNLHYGHDWSLNLYGRLKDCSYDICHFQDNNGNGFVSALAKNAGLHFDNTLFTCTLHSPDQWIRQANRQYSHAGGRDLHMDFMERQAAEKCDYIVAPVNYMLGYVSGLGWDINKKARVIPYLIDGIKKAPQKDFNGKHLIFFGRLETRKGLEIFVDALVDLGRAKEFRRKNLRVTFLGKPNFAYGRDAMRYLSEHQIKAPSNHRWEFQTDLDHFQALSYLRNHSDALVVIPSPIDNSPYTVIECLEMGLNVIAADTGGIPELFGGTERLFRPTFEGLRNKLEAVFSEKLPELPSCRYSRESAEKGWTQFIEVLEKELTLRKKDPARAKAPPKPKTCVILTQSKANGNLVKALDSLQKQTNKNFSLVVAVDDMSESKFNSLKNSYAKESWSFERHPNEVNGAVQAGRIHNIGLSQSTSDYLIFMGGDCLAEPDMVDTLEKSIACMQFDVATCYYRVFTENRKSKEVFWKGRYFYGASQEIGLLSNCYGENVFIIRRETFQSLGGFTADPENITPEWEFFIRFSLQQHKLGVIPKFLFRKRILPHSGGTANPYSYYYSHKKSIEPMINGLSDWEKNIASNLLGVDHFVEVLNTRLYNLKKDQSIVNPESYFDRELNKLQNNYYHFPKFSLLYRNYRDKITKFFDKNEE